MDGSTFSSVFLHEAYENGLCVFIGNVDSESEWHTEQRSIRSRFKTDSDDAVKDYERLMILLASEQDIVLLRKPVCESYLQYIESYGWKRPQIYLVSSIKGQTLCEIILNDTALLKYLKHISEELKSLNKRLYLIPFIYNRNIERIAQLINAETFTMNHLLNEQINNKIYTRDFVQSNNFNVTEGIVCRSINDIIPTAKDLLQKYKKIVIKEPYGASGEGLFIIESEAQIDALCYLYSKLKLRNFQGVIIECWYDSNVSYNIQYLLNRDVIYSCVSKQILVNGVFEGSIFNESLKNELDFMRIKKDTDVIANSLYNLGYRGVIGIDSIHINNGTCFPCIEVNGRLNFSTFVNECRIKINKFSICRAFWIELRYQGEFLFEKVFNILQSRLSRVPSIRDYFVISYTNSSNYKEVNTCKMYLLLSGENEYKLLFLQNEIENMFSLY